MLERIKRAAIILAGLALFGFVIFWVGVASNYQKHNQGEPQGSERANNGQSNSDHTAPPKPGIHIECEPNCSAQESNDHANESAIARFIRKAIDDPLTAFTGVLALTTLALAGYTAMVARATKAAAEYIPVVEGANVYVVIKKEEVSEHIQSIGNGTAGVDFEIPIYIALRNFGKTPAFIESFTARLCYASTAKRVFGFVKRVQPNTIIAAETETNPPLRVVAPQLSRTDAEAIHRVAAHLLIEGALVYRDIWSGKWAVYFDGRSGNDDGRFRLDNYPRKKNT